MEISGQEQIAELFGVAPKTIVEWQGEGFPVAVRGGPGVPSRYETADCIKWYVTRELSRAGIETPRDRLFKLQAEDLEITLAQKRSQLVPANDLRPRLRAVVIAAREALRNEAPRLAGLVVGLERQACEDLLRENHETFLRKLARLELAGVGVDFQGHNGSQQHG